MSPQTPLHTPSPASARAAARLSARRPGLAAALCVLLASATLPAPPAGAYGRLAPQPLAIELVDRTYGDALPEYRHAGRRWVSGVPGEPYAVRLRNTGPERLLVVLSVDGVNAVDGRTAGLDRQQAGYVIGPYQSMEVAGWRKSMGSVARFVFVDPAASYAARTGRPDNVGVVGVAVFRERDRTGGDAMVELPRPHRGAGMDHRAEPQAAGNTERRAEAQPAGDMADAAAPQSAAEMAATPAGMHRQSRTLRTPSAAPAPQLGTGHGALEHAMAYQTPFEREARPSQVVELRYDTLQALMARGIAPRPRPRYPAEPRAFPGAFVPDPPPACCGWR